MTFSASDLNESQETVIEAVRCRLYRHRDLKPEKSNVILKALQTDATARRILAKNVMPEVGEKIGVRLNIRVMQTTGIAAHSIHRATNKDLYRKGKGFYRGDVINYLPCVVLKDVYFNVDQKGRQAIASGKSAKFPMASVDATYIRHTRACFDGVSISFNPHKTHLFVDEDGFAIQYASEATVLGHRVYARGVVKYYSESKAPQKAGNAYSLAKFKSK